MNDKRRSFRLFWILGLLLLVGSVAGARMVLNNGQGNKDAENPNPSPSSPGERICLGKVDSEHGIASLFPAQTGRVVWVVPENNKVRTTGCRVAGRNCDVAGHACRRSAGRKSGDCCVSH